MRDHDFRIEAFEAEPFAIIPSLGFAARGKTIRRPRRRPAPGDRRGLAGWGQALESLLPSSALEPTP